MRTFRAVLAAFALALFGVAVAVPVRADEGGLHTVHQKITVTTTRPLEIPGQVLPPGNYVFKVMDIVGTRNIMQITNSDETEVIATLIGIPTTRLKAEEKSVVEYKEAAAGTLNALRAWFYRGDKNGLAFVYPKKEAVAIAQVSHEVVPAQAVEAAPTPEALKSVPLVEVTPEGKEQPITQAAKPIEVAQALPKTASSVPLIVLLGGMFVAAGFGLKKFAKMGS